MCEPMFKWTKLIFKTIFFYCVKLISLVILCIDNNDQNDMNTTKLWMMMKYNIIKL